ncbi:hypothetical protein BGX34_002734 [Mortierella sp. NVP85]|nr:hypothetical protein BGX34_002734 [Mortierella sp. NVP85]
MSQSLMVYPNSNEFLHMAPTMLDENVAKLINAEPLESYLASASTSPVQDYIMPPSSYHPQQEQSNQRQHQLFPAAAHVPTVVSHSAPNSPPYAVVKTEEVQPNPVDYLLFDLPEHILPSQQRTFANVSLIQQHQQHQQQQQHHAQQLRMQHRQQQFQQQQMMYDTPNHSTVTSSMMSTMVSAASSNSLFAPSAIATSAPFFNATTPLAQDDAFQRRNYAPAAHPAAPKRKRDDNESDESSSPSTPALNKIKTTRSTKVLKPSSSPSPVASYPPVNELTGSDSKSRKKAVAIKKAISESRESSEQPESAELSTVTYPSRVPGSAGNVTHPRRAAQNRAAQRTFRNRRKAYIKELEQKVSEIDSTRELMDAVRAENQEVWRRLQVLEALASRNGLQLPAFAPLTSIAATTTLSADGVTSISVVAGNDYGLAMDNSEMMMMNHLGSSDDE